MLGKCNKCGHPLKLGAVSCRKCGHRVDPNKGIFRAFVLATAIVVTLIFLSY